MVIAAAAGNPLVLVGGAGALFVALLVVGTTIFVPGQRKVVLNPAMRTTGRASSTALTDLAARASAVAERSLAKTERRKGAEELLEHAGLSMRVGELAVIVAIAAATSFVLGLIVGGPLAAIVLVALVLFGARTLLVVKRDRRRAAFAEQLDDLLQMLAGSLRAGYGLLQAVESASLECEAPAVDELRRLTTEVRLGRDLTDALEAMSVRVGSEDFEWVAQAIKIHREVGGDLSEVLDRVADTIRARNHLKRQVRALSAEGRMQAYVLMALPIGMAALLAVINPGYINVLFTTGAGVALSCTAVGLMVVGTLWLRRLVRPVF